MNGEELQVTSTYYMVLESGVEYTIEVPRAPRSRATIEQEAWPLIRTAFETKRYLRSRVDAYGQKNVSASRIGVRFRVPNDEPAQKLGVALGISEVRNGIARSSAPGVLPE